MNAHRSRSALGLLALVALAAGSLVACGSIAEPEGARRTTRDAPVLAASSGAPAALDPQASASPSWRPERIWLDTLDVTDLALGRDALWVASRGGVERYDAPGFERARHYTTADGLDTVLTESVRLRAGTNTVEVLTATGRCALETDRFRCTPRAPAPSPASATGSRSGSQAELRGARVTARVSDGSRVFVGTAGAGAWDVSAGEPAARAMTHSDLPCGSHVSAVAEHAGALWVGMFHGGVCRSEGGGPFVRVPAPSMVNDFAATPDGLYAATSDGLFAWREPDARFERVRDIPAEPVNRLAYADGTLYATSIEFLYRLRAHATPRLTSWQWPAGSHSLQAVAVRGADVWLASEDRGAIHFDGRAFRAFDATTGLPASWAVDVALGADGSAYVATLRHGIWRIGPDGPAPLPATPDIWTLRLQASAAGLWIGTQGGAALHDANGASRALAFLPDARVHAFFTDGAHVFVGTEGGLASYALAGATLASRTPTSSSVLLDVGRAASIP